ncbi:MAG: hypothetical protein SGI71_00230 [Verrucomicrobiota bacterium]|nr:hypothetical protein [Verrucomicrobiota bacterium]
MKKHPLRKLSLCNLVFWLMVPFGLSQTPSPKDVPVVASNDSRIVVQSSNPTLSRLVSTHAEKALLHFESVFSPKEKLKGIIRINLTESKEIQWTRFPFLYDGTLCFELRAESPFPVSETQLDLELAQIFFLRLANQVHLRKDSTLTEPPLWLAVGYSQWKNMDVDTASIIENVRPIYERGHLPLVSEIFLQNDPLAMDEPEYIANTYMLFRAFMQIPGGKDKIAKSLAMMTSGIPALQSFASHFSSTESVRDLEKIWILQTASQMELMHRRMLSIEVADRKLTTILTFTNAKNEEADLYSFLTKKREKNHDEILKTKLKELSLLGIESPIEYKTVIVEYQNLLIQGIKIEPRKIKDTLKSLILHREDLLSYQSAIKDYMNWYIVTRTPTDRAEFEQLFKKFDEDELHGTRATIVRNYLKTFHSSK